MVMWLSQGGRLRTGYGSSKPVRTPQVSGWSSRGAVLQMVLSSRGCCVASSSPPQQRHSQTLPVPTASSVMQALSPKQFLLQVFW